MASNYRNDSSQIRGRLSNLKILLLLNFSSCLLTKFLSYRANAIGPVLLVYIFVLYHVLKNRKIARVAYHCLSLIALIIMLYGIGMLYLAATRHPEYKKFLILYYSYIVLALTHLATSIYLFVQRKKS